MNMHAVATLSKKISVRDYNPNAKYICENYTILHILGGWWLLMDTVPVMSEKDTQFFAIVDAMDWRRPTTPALYRELGIESPEAMEREEENFFERPLDEILNEYHTPSTPV